MKQPPDWFGCGRVITTESWNGFLAAQRAYYANQDLMKATIATLNRLVAEFDAATDYRYDYVSSRDMLIVLASLPECRRGLADELDRALRAVACEGGAL